MISVLTMRTKKPKISIVIPTYNEAGSIESTLMPLQRSRCDGEVEVILSDGNSTDGTRDLAAPLVDLCLNESQGRARQMNSGAKAASGELLLFLHADTQLPNDFLPLLTDLQGRHDEEYLWGFFPLRLSGDHWMLRIVERCINLRSRLSSIATGDQAIFVNRNLWYVLEGFSDIPLMEDVELTRRAGKLSKARVQSSLLVTSSRRWEEKGIISTILLMWRLRWLYFVGVNPRTLAALYR